MNRRAFLDKALRGGVGAWLMTQAWARWAEARAFRRIVILHTNDVHSRIEPFPENAGPMAGLGGAARRATLVRRLRAQEPHLLLVDAGDIFQGTAYFNLFRGELDFRTMSAIGYDLATLGNHDFDLGVEGLLRALEHARFGFLSANYRFESAELRAAVRPYAVRELAGVRVGLIGVGIDLEGLLPAPLRAGVRYEDPVPIVRELVAHLRRRERSHLVVVLSHLGYEYSSPRIDDVKLARAVPGIDLIIGGHTHTFLDAPRVIEHEHEPPTWIVQAGWGGVRLGRVDFVFDAQGRLVRRLALGYTLDGRWSA
ncbi:MAG: metallophosphatase [Bacteroidetes bacterium]|nr:metallophosphatase [Rhodothermia bacterium]MCX7907395.1 metallophosphatase [Bacteroidota bacterium]MDW8284674.1 metallophosphatase [Bacteroidota bacterium]